jgi:hypothetical protein
VARNALFALSLALSFAPFGCATKQPNRAPDTDFDGVPDVVDRCPDEAEDGLEPDARDGCPAR